MKKKIGLLASLVLIAATFVIATTTPASASVECPTADFVTPFMASSNVVFGDSWFSCQHNHPDMSVNATLQQSIAGVWYNVYGISTGVCAPNVSFCSWENTGLGIHGDAYISCSNHTATKWRVHRESAWARNATTGVNYKQYGGGNSLVASGLPCRV